MLDLRIYRAALAPALLVLVVCAFSLGDRPRASTTTLAPGAFDTLRAYGEAAPPAPPNSLLELADAFPERPPGGAGDAGLAQRVAEAFEDSGFDVEVQRREAATIDGDVELATVVGTRAGLSSRRIVVVAHRDAAQPRSLAELSGTAALLELARVFRARCPRGEEQCGRELRRTLVLVSTSGGTGGAGGVRNWLRRADGTPVDAVLVLGDMAGARIRKPWVVAWSNGHTQPPLALRRTVEAAVRRETGQEPGGPRATAQWIRRAFPLSPGEQPELAAAGMPAVQLSASGERGAAAGAPVSERRLEEFGRAALRAISAVDAAGIAADGSVGAAFAETHDGIVTLKRVLPGWAVRLLVGALLAPALVATLDAVARVRRRRRRITPWLAWVAAAALPFALAWAWMRLLGLLVLDVPAVPLLESNAPIDGGGWALLGSTLAVFAAGWFAARALVRAPREASPEGAGAAVAFALCAIGALAWVVNPYTAGLLLPAIHGGLLLAAPEARLRGWRAGAVGAVAVAPLVAVLLYYASALGLGPVALAWVVGAATAGGHVSPAAALAGAGIAGCLVRAATLAARRPGASAPRGGDGIVTRGPLGYAGPGSLGGTDSALRR